MTTSSLAIFCILLGFHKECRWFYAILMVHRRCENQPPFPPKRDLRNHCVRKVGPPLFIGTCFYFTKTFFSLS
ncbi:uncharacterized protein BYT42DRAFT_561847 [Radiomyces spectabilis]|uniref:uncharacterized protein n=1 Tax=Radiomyces spectabilis TaxID=64574 RepID=UPI00221F22D4|nr:uncharacterized protein BYT42DRAFT_561847 [Radiomyces spectabilis]KAI8384239.1 hypothetical protein BYT42DRAFT_561847 [Radiomyces spectabilis]